MPSFPKASATHLLVTAAAMRGTMYSRPPAGGGPHHGVEPRGDAVRSGPAPVLEDDPVVVVVRHLLHGDPHDPSCYGADRHAGNEQTRGDLEGTKNPSKGSKMGFLFISGGEDGDDDLEDECEGELPQRGVDPGARRPVGDVVHRPAHSCEDSSAPQSLNSSEISSLVLRRVYGLGNASRAVIPVTAITSSTGYFPSCVVFLRRHQAMLARMNSVPQRPPNTPSRMKGTNSAMYHGFDSDQRTSRRLPSFLLYLEKRLQKRFPQQQATWTRGPSFPRLRPDDTARTRVTVLISRDLYFVQLRAECEQQLVSELAVTEVQLCQLFREVQHQGQGCTGPLIQNQGHQLQEDSFTGSEQEKQSKEQTDVIQKDHHTGGAGQIQPVLHSPEQRLCGPLLGIRGSAAVDHPQQQDEIHLEPHSWRTLPTDRQVFLGNSPDSSRVNPESCSREANLSASSLDLTEMNVHTLWKNSGPQLKHNNMDEHTSSRMEVFLSERLWSRLQELTGEQTVMMEGHSGLFQSHSPSGLTLLFQTAFCPPPLEGATDFHQGQDLVFAFIWLTELIEEKVLQALDVGYFSHVKTSSSRNTPC
ncbi:hypothetical protein F7725_008870 [Dissostichus mawsoni]|uniref:Uncharacterized protein n=1 Tax=Dissostichus mawsoni TaxID=36200 RepID=A0A7J5Z766_DISMA|nr:hypothetical protein F7725_008870 [Dissostichus mawsoni]